MTMKYLFMDLRINGDTVVVFDLDDTLYNEFEYLKSAYISIAKQLQPKDWHALFVQMISRYRNKMDVFGWLSEEYAISKESLIIEYRTHHPNIKPYTGVIEVIHAIKEKNGKIGLLTDGRTQTQTNKIRALGIADLLDLVVISENLGTEKPSLENFTHVERHFNCSYYVYIGDNLRKDFIGPNSLGWHTIGLIDNGLNIHIDQFHFWDEEHRPKSLIMSFEELNIC